MKKVVLASVVSLFIGTTHANAEWVDVSKKICINNGGYMKNGICSTPVENIVAICKAENAIVPKEDELGDVITKCGGNFKGEGNIDNQMYQSCRKEKGFLADDDYWSFAARGSVNFMNGKRFYSFGGNDPEYIRCLRP